MSARAVTAAMPGRLLRLRERIKAEQLDALLLDAPVDLRYITGYTGSNGLALVPAQGAEASVRGHQPQFLTDFRYEAQSAEEVGEGFERSIVTGELRDSVAGLLAAERGRLGFDAAKLSVKAHERLRSELPEGWELLDAGALVEELRLIKEPAEIELIRAAAELDGDAPARRRSAELPLDRRRRAARGAAARRAA